jgi:threonine/homoserine/homoserine lactone efflux protein
MSVPMQNWHILLQGLLLGFSIAAPVGPVALLCIRRTLERGFKAGLVSGLGAAMADVIYGSIAAAGLTLVADFLVGQQFWLRLLGGGFLICLGISTMRSEPAQAAEVRENSSLIGDFFSTLALTLSNPLTIFAFIAIFSGFGVQAASAYRFSAFMLVLGVFLGSALWWLGLSMLVNLSRRRLNQSIIQTINKIAALAIIGFGLYFILQAYLQM